MSVDYQHSILWRGQDPTKQKFQPSRDATKKVTRYFPGKAPAWAKEPEPEEEANEPEVKGRRGPPPLSRRERRPGPLARDRDARAESRSASRERERRRERREDTARRKPATAAVIVEDAALNRLKRLAQHETGGEAAQQDRVQERMMRHRVVQDAAVLESSSKADKDEKEEEKEEVKLEAKVEDTEPDRRAVGELRYDEVSGSDEDDNELRALRRERARELALAKRQQEEVMLKDEEADDLGEEDEDDDSDEESDSGDDGAARTLIKPVFVSKAQRDTIREKEQVQKEEEEAEVKKQEKLTERKADSKQQLVDMIRHEEEVEANGLNENDASDIELIDDDDEKNEAEEYELWKIRELKRIKRDKAERLTRQKELDWIMKRRAMTEDERAADDKRMDDEANNREEAKQFGFLQKYYHRGGFFQDKATTGEEPLYLRDYHEPLEEEKFDKQMLPKAMQLRRGQFGKKGQVKHTHLTDSDTTDMQAAWSQNSKPILRYQEKMAAAKGVNSFDRPSGSKSGLG